LRIRSKQTEIGLLFYGTKEEEVINRLKVLAILALVFLVACSSGAQDETPAPDANAPTQVFEQYRTALIENDGEAALAIVDSGTIAWYDEVLEEALSLPRDELSELGFTEKFTILRVRHTYRRYEIEDMTGEELFRAMIDRGWSSRSAVEDITVGEEHIEGNSAWISFSPEMTTPAMYFVLEDGEWKLALSQSFPIADEQYAEAREGLEYEEELFLMEMLVSLTEREVDERIFEGPLD
jgi:hypothetical protein